ncbi:MAG: carbohydrate ABC transporter permease [Candidatus Caldatribacterium sp.]|uniref:carbohydrate ABC transporter permease n=1 Tax=Candidatus Caldatribacterium sp. TaxID=2282143 RepID=UPI002993B825|nr:carbohydrate ABC transporter permease [Candidatus Caldatribacterium sp.]MCX7730670.1 carbohydrate ABC transporter permease [Candidatus Caldatribacterium sp.]MDW8081132.1 carbohydrate ABC transporter permease [Candidatus Calescibacterium sp.]
MTRKSFVFFVVIGVLVVFETYPLVWMVLSSLKAPHEFTTRPIYTFPEGIWWENYLRAWTVGRVGTYLRNSVIVTLPSLLATLFLGTMAAFGIEVMRSRWNSVVLLVFLAGIMIPVQMILLPLFAFYHKVQLLDTWWALIITYTAYGLPLTVFFMTGYFQALSREVLEAAILDGATIFQVFFRIAVPMAANALFTLAMVQFFFIWNDLVFSLTFVSTIERRTVQTGLLNFVGRFGQIEWGPTFAAIALVVIPTFFLYLFLSRFIMEGLTAGALKG